jgi:hypothetical protein
MDQVQDFKFTYPEVEPENRAMDYFRSDPLSTRMPSFNEVKEWPLEQERFEVSFTFVPENPIFMQPKETYHFEKHVDYYVSPRKMIRYMELTGKNFIFCDTFSLQTVVICT